MEKGTFLKYSMSCDFVYSKLSALDAGNTICWLMEDRNRTKPTCLNQSTLQNILVFYNKTLYQEIIMVFYDLSKHTELQIKCFITDMWGTCVLKRND